MRFEVMRITPTEAQKWLDHNRINRPIRKAHVKRLAAAMKRGEWVVNHQAIALNGTNLLDGQHRLSAILLSGLPYVEMSVIRDAKDSTFDTIDIGEKRSLSDVYRADIHVMNQVSFVARLLHIRKASPQQVAPIYEKLCPLFTEIVNSAPRNAGRFTAAPIRVAAGAAILSGENKNRVLAIYRNLCEFRAEELPRVGQIFMKQAAIDSGNSKIGPSGSFGQASMLARAWTVFQEKYAKNERLRIDDQTVQVGEVREVFRSVLNG